MPTLRALVVSAALLLILAPTASADPLDVDADHALERIGVGGNACVQVWPPAVWLSSCGIPCLGGGECPSKLEA